MTLTVSGVETPAAQATMNDTVGNYDLVVVLLRLQKRLVITIVK